jgi:2-C-methyl-D-erythritol 4-phosphate cytidylyltransferase
MSRCFALIPCAGTGSRLALDQGSAWPKQYCLLDGKPMAWHVLATLVRHPAITMTTLILAPKDPYFPELLAPHCADLGLGQAKRPWQAAYCGGSSRQHSVMNGLTYLAETAGILEDDWVLVHDAARPGLTHEMLDNFITTLEDHPVGGILALPVTDTLKYSAPALADQATGPSSKTLEREGLWQAQTPQMFRFGLLHSAMRSLIERGQNLSDEASAMEQAGFKPLLIFGHICNFKVTYANDLQFAQALIRVR